MDYDWRPYIPVAARRAKARREMQKLLRKGAQIQPVEIEGRKIARSFWGAGWCKHLSLELKLRRPCNITQSSYVSNNKHANIVI